MKIITQKIVLVLIIFMTNIYAKAQCPIANQTPSINPSVICGSGSSTVSIPSSEVGVMYSLISGTTIVSGPTAGNGSSLTFTTGSISVTTTFSVAASNGTCAISMSPDITLTINPLPVISITPTHTVICRGKADTLNVSGALTYTWMPGNSNALSFIVTPTVTTSYTVTGTDVLGCSNSAVQTVSVNFTTITLSVTPGGGICAGQTATISAGGATSYTWSTSANTSSISVSPVSTTIYTIMGSNATGCVATRTRTITVNPTSTISISGPTIACLGSTVSLTASGSLSYTWNTGATGTSISVSPTVTTTYSVICGSGFGTCPGTASYTLMTSPNPPPTIAINGTSVTCNGQLDTLTASGANTYTWSANAGGVNTTTVSLSPTANTTYTVRGTDNNGCSNLSVFTVTVNPLPNVTITGNKIICLGSTTTLTANNALNYVWSSGATTNTIGLSPSTNTSYTVIGTSAAGCSKAAITTITVNALPTLTVTPITICYPATGTLTANPSNLISYTWSPGLSSTSGASVTGSPSVTTNYTVYATDNNGCVGSTIATINSYTNLTVSASASSTNACSGSSITLTGLGASSYSWTSSDGSINGINGTNISVSPTGTATTYTVNGSSGTCSASPYTLTINVNALPIITSSASPNNTICAGKPVTLIASGASSYSWTNGVVNGVAFTPTSTITYTVTGTDVNGCKNTNTQQVTVNPLPTITITATPGGNICPGQTVTLTASGVTSYTWSSNAGSATTNSVIISPNSTTVYSVTGVNGLGCANTRTRTETVRTAPVILVTGQNVFCIGSPVSATLTASGATSYTWNTGSNSPSITVSPTITTSYSVVGTGTNICTTTVLDTVYLNTCAGLNNINKSILSSVYPNPSNGEFNVVLNLSEASEITYQIINTDGKMVYSDQAQSSNGNFVKSLDLSSIKKGMYYIRVITRDDIFIKKIIIH